MILRTEYGWGVPGTNPGDLIVEMGAKRLALRLGVDLEAEDVVYLIGTPWFWRGCWASPKWAWLREQHELHRHKRWVALGVGSCLKLGECGREAMDQDTGLAEAANWWTSRIATTVPRDLEVWKMLRRVGAECGPHALPCPSLWAISRRQGESVEARSGSCLAIEAPAWHAECLAPPPAWRDGADLWRYGRGTWRWADVLALLDFLLRHERIVSQRIHCAMPVAPWRPVRIMPIDGRVATTQVMGLPEDPQAWSDPAAVVALMGPAEDELRRILAA